MACRPAPGEVVADRCREASAVVMPFPASAGRPVRRVGEVAGRRYPAGVVAGRRYPAGGVAGSYREAGAGAGADSRHRAAGGRGRVPALLRIGLLLVALLRIALLLVAVLG